MPNIDYQLLYKNSLLSYIFNPVFVNVFCKAMSDNQLKVPTLSFLRSRESITWLNHWIPACAGMTKMVKIAFLRDHHTLMKNDTILIIA